MMHQLRALAALLTVASALAINTACVDTCGDRTFNDLDVTQDGEALVVSWTRARGQASRLPDAYFEEVQLQAGEGVVGETTFVPPDAFRVELASADLQELSASLFLPDRRRFTQCVHVGTDDRYGIDLTVDLEEGVLRGFTATERFDMGVL